jgi:high-affinity iron transporter
LDIGFLTTGLLTGLREGVEAALIVSIILAYLARTGNARSFGKIWIGTGASLALSLVIGVALFLTIGELPSPTEQIFEASAMLLAAVVVTWMLFWMRRTAASIRGELQAGIDRALTTGSVWGLSALAFTAVIREGVETALFLLGQVTAASQANEGALSTLAGAAIGLAAAGLLGYGFYRGARIINLRTFFTWTGLGLIFVAAGLVANAVHELIEVNVIQVGTGIAFDISDVLAHEPARGNVLGQLLHAVFGYSSTPEWTMLVVWVGYLLSVLGLYTRPMPAPPSSSPAPEHHPASSGRPAS